MVTGRRAVTVAVAGSLLLHGGAVAGLWLSVGVPAVVPPAQALPRLFVDLVDEPVVVARPATAPAPVSGARPAASGSRASAPTRAAPVQDPPAGPPPPVAPPPVIAPPPSPPAPPAATASQPPPAAAGPVVVALVPAPAPSAESPAPAAMSPPVSGSPITGGGGGGAGGGAGGGGAGPAGTPAPPDGAPVSGSGIGRLAALPAEAPGGVPPEYDAYVRRLRDRIQTRLQYPWQAARRGLQGVVELEIRIEPDGRLGQAEVVGGVPVPLLQRAALHAVEAATPAPFPPGVAARPLTIRLPVVFELR